MKAASLVSFLILVALCFGGTNGFSLEIKFYNVSTTSNSSSCQIICEDLSSGQSNVLANRSGDTLQNETSEDDGLNFQRMVLYKVSPDIQSVLGEVSSEENIVSRVEERLAVEGILSATQASLQVDLYSLGDCRSDFRCQVLMSDGQVKVREVTNGQSKSAIQSTVATPINQITSSAQPLGSTTDDDTTNFDESLDLTPHLLTLVEDLKAELALMQTRFDEMKDLEQRLSRQIATAEQRQRNEIVQLSAQVRSSEQRIKDDITVQVTSSEKRINDDIASQFTSSEQRIKDTVVLEVLASEKRIKDGLTTEVTSSEERIQDNMSTRITLSEQRIKDTITFQVTASEKRSKDELTTEVTTSEQRIKDSLTTQITSSEKRIKDDLTTKVSTTEGRIMGDITTKVTSSEQRIKDDVTKQLTSSEQRQTDQVLKNSAQLESVKNDIIAQVIALEDKVDIVTIPTNNATSCSEFAGSVADNIKKLGEDIIKSVGSNISALCLDLAGNIEESSEHYLNLSDGLEKKVDQVFDSVVLIGQSLENVTCKQEKANLTQKIEQEVTKSSCTSDLKHSQCKKGMLPIPAPPKHPYPVFCPDQSSIIDLPFLCDTNTTSGGWIVIQRRASGFISFSLDWEDYKEGFGSLDNDFWLGLEAIHKLTTSGRFELRVDMNYGGVSAHASYSNFSVAGENDNYQLVVEGYSGTAGDGLAYHNGMDFSTEDRDNDESGESCAVKYTGGWWYNSCFHSNLNGQWLQGDAKGLVWNTFTSSDSASFSEMKIRSVSE